MLFFAEPAPPPVLAVEVTPVVVIGSARLPPPVGADAYALVEVDEEAIRTAPRLDEALTLVPGVQTFRRTTSVGANPTTQGITVRAIAGSGAGRALVTLDGVPQNDPFGGWVIWSGLPSADIGDAQVLRGAGAGPYGAGALTGTVQLGEVRVVPSHGEYELWGGDRGSAGVQAVVGGGDFVAVASAQTTDGWVPVRKGRGAADTPLTYSASSLSGRWSPSFGDTTLSLRAAGYREARDSGLAGATSRATGVSTSATLTGDGLFDGSTGWRLQGWARASDFENSSWAVGAGRAFTTPAAEQYGTPAIGLGFNAALRFERFEIGADVRYADGETREHFRNLGAGFTRQRTAGGSQSVAGVYAEGWWIGQNSLVVTGGVRIDRWSSFDGSRIERDIASGTPTLEIHPADADGWRPTARLGVRKNFRSFYLRSAAYAGFRAPTLNELHRPFRVGNDITEANSALEPEVLYGGEVAIGGRARVDWSAGMFVNRLEGAVTNVTIGFGPGTFPVAGFVPAGGVLRQRQNAGDVDAWGLEADVNWPVSPRLTLSASGAWTRAEVDGGTAAPQLTGLRPAQTPELAISARARWTPLPKLALTAVLRHEGDRWDDDLNTRRLSAATTLDFRAEWRVAATTTVYLAADNVTDAAVETAQTADGIESYGQPRTVRAGLIFRP